VFQTAIGCKLVYSWVHWSFIFKSCTAGTCPLAFPLASALVRDWAAIDHDAQGLL